MIQRLLIANRGEIACRIIRTARRVGIETVAVFSDADANSLHVRVADAAVHIGASPASESYLVGETIIAAARQAGADAIHPGFGFLSENAQFAQDVIDAGLIWIGPDPKSIEAMGLKDAAKSRMQAAGVPVTPGYMGAEQSLDRLIPAADAIGYPVLIKAIAGGGGKGMRKVEHRDDFAAALQSCQREAKSAFGDDRVLIEKLIARPRHIEVQVFGDKHGNVVHLFERDCSLQRRHQKVIEEAPAPGMDETTRAAICNAAVKAAKSISYVGAGTIEFIADASEGLRPDRTWFMEMNTRLQVEHPVTEAITGIDLVEWQLRIASGETLPKLQKDIVFSGHAIEARLYAEDPARAFMPSTGRLDIFELPDHVRIETGVEQGNTITSFYDPMIAKLIAHAATRTEAIETLKTACETVAIYPVKTNASFLARALATPGFIAGDIDTGFIPSHSEALNHPLDPSLQALELASQSMLPQGQGPWFGLPGFRMNAAPDRHIRMRLNGHFVSAASASFASVKSGRMRAAPQTPGPKIIHQSSHQTLIAEGGEVFAFTPDRTEASHAGTAGDGAITAPIPGRISHLVITTGQSVKKGETLVVLEAMKMEYTLSAPFDGIVEEIAAGQGDQVTEGAVLVKIVEDNQ
ncbi:acetyl/propionyl/methylcrotonyl-CoA carboxylase subunit alpha [Pelagibacterium luteolum]|uniref:3-methylcrotonyl-CoA carboxylase alpha subunit n=1 Tax=Pelagibacterium luteolum TaxID=440168 RepID=A0A1G7WHC2_9HYPH|nr:biotin carboxylase N-terminal domain-containing protein [Pelagibacterium luteolum]SDG71437.1 3-methylcrotonyl-CoA carboxylase alpha subunit [Pelagibacterium luteolum]